MQPFILAGVLTNVGESGQDSVDLLARSSFGSGLSDQLRQGGHNKLSKRVTVPIYRKGWCICGVCAAPV